MNRVYKVSIIIAIYNSHRVVVRQLRHFKKMKLPETVEIIFVDDGSFPPLSYENCGLRNFRVLYTHNKKAWTEGLARNMGASLAKGEYLFFTDIDHILTIEAINDVLNFDGDKMVFPRFFGMLNRMGELVKDKKSVLEFGLRPDLWKRKNRLPGSGGFHGNTFAIRKTLFEKMGGYAIGRCTNEYHSSIEKGINYRFERWVSKGRVKEQSVGSSIYFYPTGLSRTDGNFNAYGLFHNLSFEQVPQPMKE